MMDDTTRNVFPRFCRTLAGAVAIFGLSLGGCSLTYETTKSARSPVEQLLMTQSLQRTLSDAVAPAYLRQPIVVEAVGLTGDNAFVAGLVEQWLSREGFSIPKDGKEGLIARVNIEAFGTLQDQTFIGIPPIGGGLFPIALPELALYKASRQRGQTRFSINFLDKKTGQFVLATPAYEGSVFYNQYTIFFVFNLNDSDLLPPLPE
jgi:hypothetical protein